MRIKSSEINFPRNLGKEEVREALVYLDEFVGTFSDPVMVGAHEKIIRSTFISGNQIKLISKRKFAISTKEMMNPEAYIIKYWRALLPSITAAKCPNAGIKLSLVIREKINTIIDFFEAFGFLNDDHIDYLKTITLVHADQILNKSKMFIRELTVLTTDRQKEMYIFKKFLKEILQKLQPNIVKEIDFYKTEEQSENIFYQFLINLLKNRETQLRYSQEEVKSQPIPQTFLTLTEMRKALIYIP